MAIFNSQPQNQTRYSRSSKNDVRAQMFPFEGRWKNELINSTSPYLYEDISFLYMKADVAYKLMFKGIQKVYQILDLIENGELDKYEPTVVQEVKEQLKAFEILKEPGKISQSEFEG